MNNFKNLQSIKRKNSIEQQTISSIISNYKEEPLVSIITPSYRRPNLLPMCIESVNNQIYKNWEHIITIEEISDKYLEIIKKNNNSKRKFIINKTRIGCGLSRKIAIENSNGSIIFYIDDDDIFYKDHLFSRHKYFFEYDFIYSDSTLSQKTYLRNNKVENNDIILSNSGPYSFERLQNGNFITSITVCHTKKVYDMTDGFFSEPFEDWKMWKRILLKTNKILYLEKITCETRHFLNELRGPCF